MFDSLLAFLRDCREPMSAAALWADIDCIRRNGSSCLDLPATESELCRQLRHAKIAGLVAEEAGLWRVVPRVALPRKVQAELFA